jgi:hypothetical protein
VCWTYRARQTHDAVGQRAATVSQALPQKKEPISAAEAVIVAAEEVIAAAKLEVIVPWNR